MPVSDRILFVFVFGGGVAFTSVPGVAAQRTGMTFGEGRMFWLEGSSNVAEGSSSWG